MKYPQQLCPSQEGTTPSNGDPFTPRLTQDLQKIMYLSGTFQKIFYLPWGFSLGLLKKTSPLCNVHRRRNWKDSSYFPQRNKLLRTFLPKFSWTHHLHPTSVPEITRIKTHIGTSSFLLEDTVKIHSCKHWCYSCRRVSFATWSSMWQIELYLDKGKALWRDSEYNRGQGRGEIRTK